jgi:hypothetical protein
MDWFTNDLGTFLNFDFTMYQMKYILTCIWYSAGRNALKGI